MRRRWRVLACVHGPLRTKACRSPARAQAPVAQQTAAAFSNPHFTPELTVSAAVLARLSRRATLARVRKPATKALACRWSRRFAAETTSAFARASADANGLRTCLRAATERPTNVGRNAFAMATVAGSSSRWTRGLGGGGLAAMGTGGLRSTAATASAVPLSFRPSNLLASATSSQRIVMTSAFSRLWSRVVRIECTREVGASEDRLRASRTSVVNLSPITKIELMSGRWAS